MRTLVYMKWVLLLDISGCRAHLVFVVEFQISAGLVVAFTVTK